VLREEIQKMLVESAALRVPTDPTASLFRQLVNSRLRRRPVEPGNYEIAGH
jgi:hypothetical protein